MTHTHHSDMGRCAQCEARTSRTLPDLLDTMQARCDEHVDSMDGREDRWYMDLVNDSIRLNAAVRAVLDEHPRYEGDFSDFCGHCQARGEGTWPCPTVTAITAALDADA